MPVKGGGENSGDEMIGGEMIGGETGGKENSCGEDRDGVAERGSSKTEFEAGRCFFEGFESRYSTGGTIGAD